MNRENPVVLRRGSETDIRSSLEEITLPRGGNSYHRIHSAVEEIGSGLAYELHAFRENCHDARKACKLHAAKTINKDTAELIQDENLWSEFKARLEKSGHITTLNTKELLSQFLAEKKAQQQMKAAQDKARDMAPTADQDQQGAIETTKRRRKIARSLSGGILKRLSLGSIEEALGGIEKALKEEECTTDSLEEESVQHRLRRRGSDSILNNMASLADESSVCSLDLFQSFSAINVSTPHNEEESAQQHRPRRRGSDSLFNNMATGMASLADESSSCSLDLSESFSVVG